MTGVVVWLTGLPRSGKSSLAARVRQRLAERGRGCVVLDGDEVRGAITPAPGYDPAARDAFYSTLAQLAALVARQDVIVIVPATANRSSYRARARELAPRFIEVYVAASAEECVARDAHGLYRDAAVRVNLPGAGARYEIPEHPDVVARGAEDDSAVDGIVALLA